VSVEGVFIYTNHTVGIRQYDKGHRFVSFLPMYTYYERKCCHKGTTTTTTTTRRRRRRRRL
jgi:hypothetical protein